MSVQRHFALAHEREELAQPGKNQFQSLAVVEMILIGYPYKRNYLVAASAHEDFGD
jgi:hypothetical protein